MEATPADARRPGTTLLGIALAALVLGRFGGPVGDWVGAVGTAAHEAGHAAVADVLTGDVLSMTVFRDGGGVTVSQASSSDWRSAAVSGAGYPTALLASLALLTGAVLARRSNAVAGVGAAAAALAWLLWTPWSSRVPGIDDGDQHFTWIVLGLTAVLLGAVAAPQVPERARRIALGAVGVGLLTDAFRSTRDLVTVEGSGFAVDSDADALADSLGLFSSSTWAWLMRLGLFAVAAGWAWLALRRWGTGPEGRAGDTPA